MSEERETAADEQTEALDTLANPTATPGMRIGAAGIAWNEAEMLRRDLSAARARTNAAFSAFEAAGYDLSENDGDLADLVRELAAERDAARAEVERLRARDEAVQAVVQAWRANEAAPFEGTTPALFAALDALDALARAHKDGGQDR